MKHIVKPPKIIIFLFCLLPVVSVASTVKEALAASHDNQEEEAVRIWSQLASSGNSIAKYNLGNHYLNGEGVEQDQATANNWFKNATRSGLVQAYQKLNKKALVNGSGVSLKFDIGPLYWLQNQESKMYTIQLMSSSSENSIMTYYKENDINNQGGYFKYSKDGRVRFALVYGTYPTVADATKAISELPKNLRKKSPWVRRIKSLKKISIN